MSRGRTAAELREAPLKLARQKPRYGYSAAARAAEPTRVRKARLPAVRGRAADGAAQASGAQLCGGAAVDQSQTGVDDGLHHRWIGDRADGAHPQRGRHLHARVPGTGS